MFMASETHVQRCGQLFTNANEWLIGATSKQL